MLMASTLEFTSIQNLSDLQFIHNSIRKASHGAFYKTVDLNASKIKCQKKKKGKRMKGAVMDQTKHNRMQCCKP